MLITPPQQHWQVEELFSAGRFPIMTVGDPGFQGVVTGMHGIGVRTPSAAAVAAATIGFAIDMQTPNGGMFTNGAKSMMVAAGMPPHMTRLVGSTFSVDGAAPNGHIIIPVETTCMPIAIPFGLGWENQSTVFGQSPVPNYSTRPGQLDKPITVQPVGNCPCREEPQLDARAILRHVGENMGAVQDVAAEQ